MSNKIKQTIGNVEWWKCAGVRALKTFCQTAIATIGTAAVLNEVNWTMVVSASALAGILSLLTSIAGLPEVKERRKGGLMSVSGMARSIIQHYQETSRGAWNKLAEH